eukprot:PhM_4_TR5845/c0_g1_i1/m.22916/K01811/xylS, yicI; alpha-D-xyloside xylohydrolase
MYSREKIRELVHGDAPTSCLSQLTSGNGVKIVFIILWVSSVSMLWTYSGSSKLRPVPVLVPPAKLPRSTYSPWVHGHWVRLHTGLQTSESVRTLLRQYRSFGIPVTTVTLDAGWNSWDEPFIPNATSFPDFSDLVKELHKAGVRVVLSSTAALDEGSAAFAEAKKLGYLVNSGDVIASRGVPRVGLLDYSNPDAVQWWHAKMSVVVDLKIDGWKNEGVDAFIRGLGTGVVGKAGFMEQEQWGRKYYWDYFDHLRQKVGFDTVTMFRPVDSWRNYKYLEFGPQDISFACWVGDHPATFEGLRESLMNMFHSAKKRYINLGSAIGGTGDTHLEKAEHKELFIRWVQLGVFTPIFENGGMGVNHAPWAFDEETVSLYRRLVLLHLELEPFFVSEATEAFASHRSVLRPIHDDITFADPDTWDFLVGDDILVAPIIQPHGVDTYRNVTFPSDSEWTDWWDPSKVYKPGERLQLHVPLNHFPVFKRRGTIVPMKVTTDTSDFGTHASAGSVTLVIDQPLVGRGDVSRKVVGEHDNGLVVLYSARMTLNGRYTLHVALTSYHKSVVIVLRGIKTSNALRVRAVYGDHVQPLTVVATRAAFFSAMGSSRAHCAVERTDDVHSTVYVFYADMVIGGQLDIEGLVVPTEEENAHRKLEV